MLESLMACFIVVIESIQWAIKAQTSVLRNTLELIKTGI